MSVVLLLWAVCAAATAFDERLARVEAQIQSDARAAVAEARVILAGAHAAQDAVATAAAQRVLGMALNVLGDNRGALDSYAEARKGYAALGDRSKEALVMRHEGVSHYDLGQYDQALTHYLEALSIFEARNERLEVAKTRANIANVYQKIDKLDQAIQYQREALAEFERSQLPIGIAGTALNLGAGLMAVAERADTPPQRQAELLAEAEASYRKALSIFKALEIPRGVLKAEGNLATVQYRMGDIEGARRGLLRARELAAGIGDSTEESVMLTKLLELELDRGLHAAALEHAQQGIELAVRNTDPVSEENFQRGASQAEEVLGNLAAALKHARRADDLARERVGRDMEVRLAELTRQYEDEQRDQELVYLRQSKALDRAQLSRQRVQRNAAVVIGVLALFVLALVWSRQRLRERSRRELELAVHTDPLTGLLNRRGLRAGAASMLSAGGGHALILCDIDNFKQINDLHGHDCGDLVLAETARRLRAGLRAQDCAARWGGEEFLLVLPAINPAQAQALAERLRLAVASTPIGSGLSVTLSFGLALAAHGESLDDTVRLADQALLQAKREGKNRVVAAPGRIRSIPAAAPRLAQG